MVSRGVNRSRLMSELCQFSAVWGDPGLPLIVVPRHPIPNLEGLGKSARVTILRIDLTSRQNGK